MEALNALAVATIAVLAAFGVGFVVGDLMGTEKRGQRFIIMCVGFSTALCVLVFLMKHVPLGLK